jgi:enamine deaminase RidA (YjgF/YER057c/UK114 family)
MRRHCPGAVNRSRKKRYLIEPQGVRLLLFPQARDLHGSLELGDITLQSECTLQALKVALEKAGSSMDRVLHLTIYLTDMADRAAFNEVYKRFFAKPWPVRAAVGVAALATPGMRVEVTAMAAKG